MNTGHRVLGPVEHSCHLAFFEFPPSCEGCVGGVGRSGGNSRVMGSAERAGSDSQAALTYAVGWSCGHPLPPRAAVGRVHRNPARDGQLPWDGGRGRENPREHR